MEGSVGFQLRMNEACRDAGTAFVSASSRGAFASLFCDFGDSFVVDDQDGEEALVRGRGMHMRADGRDSGKGCMWIEKDRQTREITFMQKYGDGESKRERKRTGSAIMNCRKKREEDAGRQRETI